MNAETELLFPYLFNFSQELQQFEEFYQIQKSNASTQSTVSEYDLGGEGDLFKAPEPIIGESMIGFDPMITAISMITCGENNISSQTMKATEIESIQNDQLLSDIFYECKKDLLDRSAIEQFPEVLGVKIPAAWKEEVTTASRERWSSLGQIQKAVSYGCLSSMEWLHRGDGAVRPNIVDFWGDSEDANGMRRVLSEGDIQTLGNGNTSLTHSPFERPFTIGNYTIEERKQMLSRYRKKKTKRNFSRKIKYACRKALADNQPRIRGRFAKAEESEFHK